MNKISKQKLSTTTAILALLMISSTTASLMPTAHAQAISTTQTQTLNVLSNVFGLNTQSYQVSQSSQLSNQYNGLPQNEAIFNLVSSQGSLKADCSFVNNTLRLLYLSNYQGTPSFTTQTSSNTVAMAQGFLERYQSYVNSPFYSTLASMLSTTNENVNSSAVSGNIKLSVSNFDQETIDYTWTYVDSNGVEAASKNVLLSYWDGQLQCFQNNWPLYTVVSDTPQISAAQATAIAINASKSFSYQVTNDNGTQTVSGFTIAPASLTGQTLSYLNFPDPTSARGGDPFTLYPSWYIQLGFDKFYPGDVTGMTVTVWADTGQISSMYQTTCDAVNPLLSNQGTGAIISSSVVPNSVLAVLAFCAVMAVLVKKSAALKSLYNRKFFAAPLVVLLCLGLATSISVGSLPRALASSTNSLYGASMIYGIWNGTGLPATEATAGNDATGYIDSMSLNDGYFTMDEYGPYTINTTVYSDISYADNNFGQVASFYFGHFSVAYYTAIQDNNGNPIYASGTSSYPGISNYTIGNDFFVWDWACVQANASSYPFPVSWTKNYDMSNNGFDSPDYSLNCFITFQGISPEIGNSTGTFNCTAFPYENPGPLENFIKDFYQYTLSSNYQYTIHSALNLASLNFFGVDYDQCVLNVGYDGAYYPVDDNYWQGMMNVFGDSSLQLYQPHVYIQALGDDNSQLYPSFTINGAQGISTGYYYFMADRGYQISVPEHIGIYHFDHFYYNGGYYYQDPAPGIAICTDGTLTAYYVRDYIDILSSNTGYTTPSAGYYTGSGSMQITATPYDGYEFSYWLLNNNYLSSDSTVTVSYGTSTVQPVFYPYAWLTVSTSDGYGSAPANIYVDGNWIGYGSGQIYLPLGWHYISADNPVWDDNYGAYAIILSGSGWVDVTSDTYVTISYGEA